MRVRPVARYRDHRLSIWLAGSPVLLYACILAGLSPSGFPSGLASQGRFPWLADNPVGEDGFYMLTVAWNFASGQGPVANPGGEPTTGIQPLATAILAAVGWVVRSAGGDRWTFVRAVIALGGIAAVLCALLLGRVAAKLAPAETSSAASSITFSLAVGSFFLFRLCTYGLETGVYLIMMATVVLRSLALGSGHRTWRSAVGLGMLAGLTDLARLDFGVIFAVMLSVLLLSRGASFRWLAVCGSTGAVMVAPWFVWIYEVSGSLLPSSGLAQAGVADGSTLPGRLAAMAGALVQDVTPWSATDGRLPLTLLTVLEWAMVAAVLAYRGRCRPRLLSPAAGGTALAWAAGVAILIPIYVVFFWSSHFYARYMAPLSVLAFPVIGSGLAGLLATHPERKCAGLTHVAMLLSFFLHAVASLHTGHIGNTHVLSAAFVRRHFAAERVGAFQSGVIGYFNDNVLNLDGKINGEALYATRAGKLAEYVDRAGIEVLIDWPEVLRGSLTAAYLRGQWVECETQPPLHRSLCLKRKRRTRPGGRRAMSVPVLLGGPVGRPDCQRARIPLAC